MPIWLRNFTFKKLEEYYKKKEEANSKANKQLGAIIENKIASRINNCKSNNIFKKS